MEGEGLNARPWRCPPAGRLPFHYILDAERLEFLAILPVFLFDQGIDLRDTFSGQWVRTKVSADTLDG